MNQALGYMDEMTYPLAIKELISGNLLQRERETICKAAFEILLSCPTSNLLLISQNPIKYAQLTQLLPFPPLPLRD